MYTDTFLKEAITFDVLPKMTDHDLQQLGIKELGKRKKLLAAITELPNIEQIEPPVQPKTPQMVCLPLRVSPLHPMPHLSPPLSSAYSSTPASTFIVLIPSYAEIGRVVN